MVPLVKVALDTNILLAIEKFKVDVFEQLKAEFGKVEFLVPEQVFNELYGLSNGKSALSKSAKVALDILSKKNVKGLSVEAKGADEALISLSNQAFIASNDKKLLEKIVEKDGKILFLRQRKFVKMN